jgi:large subunit ribosomal protein L21
VPKPDSSLSAVIVSGGKQYRVAPGDQILVDRLAAEPGSSLKLGRVLLLNDGDEVKVGNPAIDGLDVEVRVIGHRRGPRIESIRYKSKKRVRVHHGGRAHLTALEIIAVGGIGIQTDATDETEEVATTKGRAKAAPRAGRAQGAPDKKVAAKAKTPEVKASAAEAGDATPAEEKSAKGGSAKGAPEKPKTARRRTTKESK